MLNVDVQYFYARIGQEQVLFPCLTLSVFPCFYDVFKYVPNGSFRSVDTFI